MASFRPDNVKRFPLRRVRDLCGVGIGGKWLQDKIAITHTELFGYLENRVSTDHNTTTYENILRPDPERGHRGRVGRHQLLHLSRQYPRPRPQALEGHRPGPPGRRRRARGL